MNWRPPRAIEAASAAMLPAAKAPVRLDAAGDRGQDRAQAAGQRDVPPPVDPARMPLAGVAQLRYVHTVPKMPTGTFTQNTARQSTAASSPPTTRPMNMPAMPAIW